MKINKILIANRGEIAVRIMKTCREMGIKTIALYTEMEQDLPHTLLADENYNLGAGALAETYLNSARIIAIARELAADAIHPGYGFLSENADFAEAVSAAGMIFIGPSAASMRLMGDKIASKNKMAALGVALIPGFHQAPSQGQGGQPLDPLLLEKEGDKIGYPLLIKASAGGGGKGMRIVRRGSEFISALESAQREAQHAFGDDRVLLEKYIENPRHIEIQVFSDTHGQHFHFFERECSIQRRHQKVIEETPSVALGPETREKMAQIALQITRGIDYVGAGTIEFIYDTDGSFYFLEMNTRLQVEHPITEMVCGIDLVQLQIQVAQGEKLNLCQEDIQQIGHAIEVRLYAEDPDNEFLPSVGKIAYRGSPQTIGARLDTGLQDGNTVTIHFDPMLAKLIVHATDRQQAIAKMLIAIDEVPFLGVVTNRDYLKRILHSPPFQAGDTLTHFVEKYAAELLPRPLSTDDIAKSIASYLLKTRPATSVTSAGSGRVPNVWQQLEGFRNI